jgi:hypothetical protein
MKRVIGLLIFIFFLQAGYCADQSDPYTWDFGKLKHGEVAAHSFTLKNNSKKALKITAVNTSCGCTVSEVKKKVLLPGESTPVEIKFNSKGYSGAVKQFIYVVTDDIDNLVIRFIIKAHVVK